MPSPIIANHRLPTICKTSQENTVKGPPTQMASGADTFPARSSTLWPVMNDEELSMASSSSSSSSVTTTSVTTTHQQRQLLPSTSNAQLNELSAFLASTTASSGAQHSAPQTFLDDLLRDDAEGHQQSFPLLQSHEDSGTTTDTGVLSDAAFFSLGEEAQRDQTAAYSSSSSTGSPSTSSPGAKTSRLLQLETNYERKKSRAKINRKDLNSRFQELMDILHLKEDRKLNRAKILEKTIEHIEKLTAELNALKAGQPPQQQGLKQMHAVPRKAAVTLNHPYQVQSAMAQSMAQQTLVNQARNNAVGGTPLLPYAPPTWNASAVGTNLPMGPLMWLPCPVVTSSGMMLKRAAPSRPADTSSRKRGRVESVESVTTTISEPVSSSSEIEEPEVAAPSSSTTTESSIFEWSAQEIPTILSYCDAWTLVSVMGTSRELRSAARRDTLWEDLCRSRWRITSQIEIPRPVEQWQKNHDTNRIPDCSNFTSGGQLFACGRSNNIGIWGMLSHRSNGHTTRTVLQNGKATVMQVVELFIVVQNMSQDLVHLTDSISLTSKTSADTNSTFQPFTAASGAHLMPTVVAFNSESCATKDLAEIALHHGDLCVLSVFMACPGLELEDQFLQRAGTLNVLFQTNSQDRKCVKVHAHCKDHNDYDRTREKAILAVRQGTI
ncbi:hypothetical protein P3T76_010281 [Phytophthora citrophthora]|uniref:BHLH domain-containing protein n=1 Tax=Phytophthora citrophthora TaxID=4793 RepID=A0AAD9LGL9_9STRA|nr:hypothetical protein P3T76_010281 [Phytophthora citrophthora]